MGFGRKRTSRDKKVYILGAGFSKPAGSPLQKELLEKILNLVPQLDDNGEIFDVYRDKVISFLSKLFKGVNLTKLNITDVYTILDRAIINEEIIKEYTSEEIKQIKKALNGCIIYVFDKILRGTYNRDYISTFIDGIVSSKIKSKSSLDTDNVSIINLNWDILLDSLMYKIFKKSNKLTIDYGFRIVPYYGIGFVPPHLLRQRGIYPIKLIKPHGSMNWLFCPSCGRIFGAQEDKISFFDMYKGGSNLCRLCIKHSGENVRLNSILITPTFLKRELENVNIKQIWQSAKHEIQSANKLIFIGYSFPEADFEIRYLLKKNIKDTCEIEVVLNREDDINNYNLSENQKEILEKHLAPYRYKSFFNNSHLSFFFGGVERYFEKT